MASRVSPLNLPVALPLVAFDALDMDKLAESFMPSSDGLKLFRMSFSDMLDGLKLLLRKSKDSSTNAAPLAF